MSERYTKKDVRNVWENRFLPAAVSMAFDIEEWSLTVGNSSYSRPFVIDCPIPVPAYSSVMTAGGHAGMASIGMTAREAYMTLVNMACAWEAVARVQSHKAREGAIGREHLSHSRPKYGCPICDETTRKANEIESLGY